MAEARRDKEGNKGFQCDTAFVSARGEGRVHEQSYTKHQHMVGGHRQQLNGSTGLSLLNLM